MLYGIIDDMYIVSKHIDWLCAGGISIILYAIVSYFGINLFKYNVVQISFVLAYVVNHPHFIASYSFFYNDERDLIAKKITHFIVGIIVPIILVVSLLFGLLTSSVVVFTYIVNILYFFVGLHYVRQVYGISLISLAKRKVFLSAYDKWALNLSMYPLWFVSFLNGHQSTYMGNFYSIPYMSYAIPSGYFFLNNLCLILSLIVWVYLVAKVMLRHNYVPLTLVAALGSLFIWHLPSFYNFGFSYLIPMFHSLQYLLIASAVKNNTIIEKVPHAKRYTAWAVYACTVTFIAYLAFHFVPETFDKLFAYNTSVLGYTAILGIFLLFINLHHYAMDALLWRKGSRLTKYV